MKKQDRINAHHFHFLSSKEPCDVLAEAVYNDAPGLIEGYITSIYLIARFLLQKNWVLKSVEVISPSGEYIKEEYRQVIAEAFPNARLYDRYGAEEMGSLAWQCPICGNYHFNADYYGLEIKQNNHGNPRSVITKRYVSACQLAHYDLGDEIRIKGIGLCEIELPVIEIKSGRNDDILIDEHGNPLPVMPYHFNDITGLIQWQIIQQSDLSLDVNIVSSNENSSVVNKIESHIQDSLPGFRLPVRVNFVKQMNITNKFKRVISQRK